MTFDDWLDQENLGTEENPLDDETLFLMERAFDAGRDVGGKAVWDRLRSQKIQPQALPIYVQPMPEGAAPIYLNEETDDAD